MRADTKSEAVPRMTSSAVNGFQSLEFNLSIRPEEARATDRGNSLKKSIDNEAKNFHHTEKNGLVLD